jgi:hypothetical protein
MLEKRRGKASQRRERRDQLRRSDRADGDRREAPRTAPLEADLGLPAASRSGVQREAPARARRRGEWRQDGRGDADAGELGADLLGLPGEVRPLRPVLQGAAAAIAKVRAWRLDALGARRKHVDQLASIACHPRPDALARQRPAYEHAAGDTVALGAHALDGEVGEPRSVSHGGRAPAQPRPPRRRPARARPKMNNRVKQRSPSRAHGAARRALAGVSSPWVRMLVWRALAWPPRPRTSSARSVPCVDYPLRISWHRDNRHGAGDHTVRVSSRRAAICDGASRRSGRS